MHELLDREHDRSGIRGLMRRSHRSGTGSSTAATSSPHCSRRQNQSEAGREPDSPTDHSPPNNQQGCSGIGSNTGDEATPEIASVELAVTRYFPANVECRAEGPFDGTTRAL